MAFCFCASRVRGEEEGKEEMLIPPPPPPPPSSSSSPSNVEIEEGREYPYRRATLKVDGMTLQLHTMCGKVFIKVCLPGTGL